VTELCRAIGERRIVRFEYGGGLRTVEPHCHGWSGTGTELLRGYQIFGYSASGEDVGWKTFHVARMAGLRTVDSGFTPRPEFRQEDATIKRRHCSV
jgi:hypothetical protein